MTTQTNPRCLCSSHDIETMICPDKVKSPQSKFRALLQVIVNNGPKGFTLAWLDWDDEADGRTEKVLALRWNGHLESDGTLNKGYPVSRGFPSWFIVPVELEKQLVPNGVFPYEIPPRLSIAK
nr:hypothetical protein [uncultured Erwinia sp.]